MFELKVHPSKKLTLRTYQIKNKNKKKKEPTWKKGFSNNSPTIFFFFSPFFLDKKWYEIQIRNFIPFVNKIL
jgi:hypothetical protein